MVLFLNVSHHGFEGDCNVQTIQKTEIQEKKKNLSVNQSKLYRHIVQTDEQTTLYYFFKLLNRFP